MTYLVLGRRELGKSTFGACLAHRCDREIIFDPRHMFLSDDEPYGLTEWEAFRSDLWGGQRQCVIQPGADLESANLFLAKDLQRFLGTNPTGRTAIVLDDASLFDLKVWGPLFRTAPRDSVYLIITSHRPQDIPTPVRAIADYWAIFRMTMEHDLKVIDDQCGPNVRRTVAGLKERQICLWDDTTATTTMYLDPSVWYVPMKDRATAPGAAAVLPGGLSAAQVDDDTDDQDRLF